MGNGLSVNAERDYWYETGRAAVRCLLWANHNILILMMDLPKSKKCLKWSDMMSVWCINVNVWHKNENINRNTDHVYSSMFTNTTPGSTAVERSFLVNDVTEFTGILKLIWEWCFTGKKMERCCLCDQHICVFTGEVITVILQEFTSITVSKWIWV